MIETPTDPRNSVKLGKIRLNVALIEKQEKLGNTEESAKPLFFFKRNPVKLGTTPTIDTTHYHNKLGKNKQTRYMKKRRVKRGRPSQIRYVVMHREERKNVKMEAEEDGNEQKKRNEMLPRRRDGDEEKMIQVRRQEGETQERDD